MNPVVLAQLAKSYLVESGRLRRWDEADILRYQNKKVRFLVKHAYDSVRMYHETYKNAGVHPSDIAGVNDLKKLPLVSKTEFASYYPDGITPSQKTQARFTKISTSGTTGKSLSLFVDELEIFQGLLGYLRALREHQINWRKHRLTIIGDFASHTVETGYVQQGLQTRKWMAPLFRGVQWLDTNQHPKQVIEEINRFQPDFIGGYTGMLGHLTLLKEQGLAPNFHPRWIGSTGAVLDSSLRSFIQDVFNADVFEVYGATESGPIAYQCTEGCYHVFSDLVIPELLEQDGRDVGHLVVTKLYGGGTPLIRYASVNDVVSFRSRPCSCGVSGLRLERIFGRSDLAIYLPNGRVLLPSSFSEIYSRVLYGLKSTKIKETMVIQHSLTSLEVQVVIDEQAREKSPSVEDVLSVLKTGFEEKVGTAVMVSVHEVSSIERKGPRIVSHVDTSGYAVSTYG